MSTTALVARPQCTACLRPVSACICRWVAPTAHAVEVLVLQHPLELHQAKGSARLLQLSLAHCRLVVGEAFAAPVWPVDGKHTLLLYPDSQQDTAPDLRVPPPLPPEWRQAQSRLRLVVLDGTWRKSRKMLYQSPPLQQLPRLALRNLPPSHYRIRKAHGPDQLSTLEATCYALGQLEGDAARFQPLLDAFDAFVEYLEQAGGQRNAQTDKSFPRPRVTGFI
ncbi:tRNA-uridine aminocarboxypropyltransferase [Variovorax sp. N23]|uniref:tRNA-uridine aminocarboxypropyltransferase n=1 Tax=Variovorax sp. N23 TaxID=2980555 RepID=UPI0021C5DF13|nr:tRNA-uridine aminocarboxypropyltransferase [Variovorax sp. N23]MCU4119122.1 DTW domain-containing protein [Variovorax sp. N23]